jgi:hypothetical protein
MSQISRAIIASGCILDHGFLKEATPFTILFLNQMA